jgi:hypothetical protein
MSFSCYSLKSGIEAVSKGGSLWLTFFRTFFVQRQRKYNKNRYRSARNEIAQYDRPKK